MSNMRNAVKKVGDALTGVKTSINDAAQERPSPTEIGRRLHESSLTGDGLSVHLDGSTPTTGYAVGLRGYEMRLQVETNAHRPHLAYAWAEFAAEHITRMCGVYVLGVWTDGDCVYYDISRIILSRPYALQLGRENDQLAIYDIEAGEEIRL